MKLKSSAIGFFFVLFILTIGLFFINKHANQPFLFAKVTIKLDPNIKKSAHGKQYLFIVLFDEQSKSPMPYGAYRTKVENFGESKHYILSEHNLNIMNPSANKPQKLRIKARLEPEGIAGPDRPGDLTGQVSAVSLGSSTTIIIDKLIKEK
jgi:hypothetical protein